METKISTKGMQAGRAAQGKHHGGQAAPGCWLTAPVITLIRGYSFWDGEGDARAERESPGYPPGEPHCCCMSQLSEGSCRGLGGLRAGSGIAHLAGGFSSLSLLFLIQAACSAFSSSFLYAARGAAAMQSATALHTHPQTSHGVGESGVGSQVGAAVVEF